MNLNFLIEFDQYFFHLINGEWSNEFLDFLMPWLRNDKFWIPLYIFLISFVFVNFGKRAYWFVVFAILTVSTADFISSSIVKQIVKRDRPCRTEMPNAPRVLVNCGSGYSFTSSHASNHFALAVFLLLTLGQKFKRLKYWLLTWAGLIAYAQIYVGVHFPLDVIAGGLLGTLIAFSYVFLYDHYYGNLFQKEAQ